MARVWIVLSLARELEEGTTKTEETYRTKPRTIEKQSENGDSNFSILSFKMKIGERLHPGSWTLYSSTNFQGNFEDKSRKIREKSNNILGNLRRSKKNLGKTMKAYYLATREIVYLTRRTA